MSGMASIELSILFFSFLKKYTKNVFFSRFNFSKISQKPDKAYWSLQPMKKLARVQCDTPIQCC